MKKGFLRVGTAAIALSVALLGCQSIRQGAPVNLIQTEQIGLAPKGGDRHTTIDFSLFFADTIAITSWNVAIASAGTTQKMWAGNVMKMPSTLRWDGRNESGSLAPEGTYTALLTVNYPWGKKTTSTSNTFFLDITPPSGSVTFSPVSFTPDNNGIVKPLTATIRGSSLVAEMDSWSLDIFDQDGRAVRSFDGKWPYTEMQWDGRSMNGDWVSPSELFIAQVTLRDVLGNSSQVFTSITVNEFPQPKVILASAPGAFAVTPGSGGFSPTGANIAGTMRLALSYGTRTSVNTWKVEIFDSDQKVTRTFNGDATDIPLSVKWDGKSDAGSLASEGRYTARLSVDYGTAFVAGSTTSTPFVLDLTPPTGSISLSDPLFSPLEGASTITLSVDAHSPFAKIDSWKMEIFDPENHLFRTFDAKWPLTSAVWDGRGFENDLVLSAEDYPVVVTVRDEFGNVGQLSSVVPVDILMEKTATGYRILSSRIFFKAYTADYTDVSPELAAQNLRRLGDMAEKLRKFPDYRITLVGHAVMIFWNDEKRGAIEQRDELLPLSESRAVAVRDAMVARGLPLSVFTTQGVGASDQLVPDSDLADRWQNRRVAFFIDK